MRGYITYQCHNAFNLHFGKGTYDYFKYHGKTRLNEDSFKKSPHKWQYAGLEAKLDHVLWFMWLAFKENKFSYSPPKALFFKARKKLDYAHPDDYLNEVVKKDLQYLHMVYNGSTLLFDVVSLYPNLYNEYTNNKISLETLLLLDLHIMPVFTTESSHDIIAWPQVVASMTTISPFVNDLFDKQTFLKLFKMTYLRVDK